MEPATRLMAPDVYDKWNLKGDEKKTMRFYLKKLKSNNTKTRDKYTKLWQYEKELFKFMNFPRIKFNKVKSKKKKRWFSKNNRYTLALMECYYYMNHAFVPDGYILRNVHKLNGIPGIIIHGRYDIICTPDNAYKLHNKWSSSKLVIAPMSGHGSMDKGNAEALLKAYRKFEKLRKKK